MNNNVHILNLSAYESPEIVESNREDWVTYGENNSYYDFLIESYKNSATNNAIINNVSRLVYGRGLSSLDASKKPSEYAQMVNLFGTDELKKVILDYKMLGQGAFQIHYSKDHKKIIKVLHIPVQLLAAEKCNEYGEIDAYYYSDNWEDTKKFPPKRIPAFGTSKEKVEILFFKGYTPSMKYYGCVDYQGALPYCTLEDEISQYLINEVQTGFSARTIINMNSGIPTEEQQQLISNKITDRLTGSNGKKVIVAFNQDEANKTTVESLPLDDAPEHYAFLSEECLRKIMLGHQITSPLLFGIANANGFSSNADELKNSSILYSNMVIKPMQDKILEQVDKILAYNEVFLKTFFRTLQPLEFVDLEGIEDEEVKEEETGYSFSKESDEEDTELADIIGELGQDVPEEWVLVDKSQVDYDNEENLDAIIEKVNAPKSLLSKAYEFVSTGVARPNSKSKQDIEVDGVKFYTRYRYSGPESNKSRKFCQEMLRMNKVYRKEDIMQMRSKPVNKGWGKEGADMYSIWLYKGGGSCRHFWQREVFAQFKDAGLDIKNPNVKSKATDSAIKKLEKYGYYTNKGKMMNGDQVAKRPREMTNRGFIKPKNFTTPI